MIAEEHIPGIRLRRWMSQAHRLLSTWQVKLPRSAFRYWHSPTRRNAEIDERKLWRLPAEAHGPLPAGYHVDDALAPWWDRKLAYPRVSTATANTVSFNATQTRLHRNGVLVSRGRLLSLSRRYRRLTRAELCRTAHAVKREPELRVSCATFITGTQNDSGTFGDYCIEFLLPLCSSLGSITSPVLLDADFVRTYAPQDLDRFGLAYLEVPEDGVLVEKLTVLGPCQNWDNFLTVNIQAAQQGHGLYPSPEHSSKVYLSRVGVEQRANAKQLRNICNELAVEAFLRSRGFEIVRTHLMSNEEVRKKLSRASVVAGSHGAAFTHLMFSQPRTVIELASPEWWVPCYLKLCAAIGVVRYEALAAKTGCVDIDALEIKLRTLAEVS